MRPLDPYRRVKILEDALRDDISDLRRRFIPYFQVHEFEALLLPDPQKLEAQFYDPDLKYKDLKKWPPNLIHQNASTMETTPPHQNELSRKYQNTRDQRHPQVPLWPRKSDCLLCD